MFERVRVIPSHLSLNIIFIASVRRFIVFGVFRDKSALIVRRGLSLLADGQLQFYNEGFARTSFSGAGDGVGVWIFGLYRASATNLALSLAFYTSGHLTSPMDVD